jgi:hypothetical protein
MGNGVLGASAAKMAALAINPAIRLAACSFFILSPWFYGSY